MNHSTANINISNGPHQAEHQTDSEIENDSVGDNCDSDDESILTLENFYNLKVIPPDEFTDIINEFPDKHKTLIINLKECMTGLNDLGFKTALVPRPISSNGLFWTDYPHDYLKKYCDINTCEEDRYIYFTVDMDVDGTQLDTDRNISASFSYMTREMKIKTIKIFQEFLPNHFNWRGLNTMTMDILIEKMENPLVFDFDKLRDNDIYPQVSVCVHFSEDIDGNAPCENWDIDKDGNGDEEIPSNIKAMHRFTTKAIRTSEEQKIEFDEMSYDPDGSNADISYYVVKDCDKKIYDVKNMLLEKFGDGIAYLSVSYNYAETEPNLHDEIVHGAYPRRRPFSRLHNDDIADEDGNDDENSNDEDQ